MTTLNVSLFLSLLALIFGIVFHTPLINGVTIAAQTAAAAIAATTPNALVSSRT